MHKALYPYRQTLLLDVENSGLPLVRHPWLHYSHDTNTEGIDFEFLLGRVRFLLSHSISNV